jgi:hypothetical protein
MAARTFARTALQPPYDRSFSPRDYLAFLLYIDAEIEHALMDQYLYAAWSLGGPQVPADQAPRVRAWQEVILGIAKEEMGHLVTVQNVLRFIGAPLNLSRDDYPWDLPFFPFPFQLEPLSLDSLAKYVFAESPTDWTGPLADEIRKRVAHATPRPHRVGALFDLMLKLLGNDELIPDAAFRPATYAMQATWDEWGRGYLNGARGNFSGMNPPQTPSLLVTPVQSRTDALNALKGIAEQGEATSSDSPNAPSHFVRFVKIYEDMKSTGGKWAAARRLATNPVADPVAGASGGTPIRNHEARRWARLHNQRYRMLLTYLAHSFTLADGSVSAGNRTPRGAIVNATFGEMYNLRAIAAILVTLPLDAGSQVMAGPPLQMPYTLQLPFGEDDKWQLHLDLIEASGRLIDRLVPMVSPERRQYLRTLKVADTTVRGIARQILDRSVNLALS